MRAHKIKRFSDGNGQYVEDMVAREAILKVEINDLISFEVVLSPDNINDFIIGHLVSEGFVENKNEIISITKKEKENLLYAIVKIKHLDDEIFQAMRKNYNMIWTECGNSPNLMRIDDDFNIKKLDNLDKNIITGLQSEMADIFEDFKLTGAYHYCVLFDLDGNLIAYARDIGRHNAFDKLIGSVVQGGQVDFKNTMVFSTGRLSADIVLKALRCEIPCVISRSAPLEEAVKLAKSQNLTLIGFLRGKRFNVYSNTEAFGPD